MHTNFVNRLFFVTQESSSNLMINSPALPLDAIKRLIAAKGVLIWRRGRETRMFQLEIVQTHFQIYLDARLQKKHYPPSTQIASAGVFWWEHAVALKPLIVNMLRLRLPQLGVTADLSKGREETNKFPDTDAAP